MFAIKTSKIARNALLVASLTASTLMLGACGGGKKSWSETSEDKTITTGGLDIQNFNNAAERLTNKMLQAPRVSQELAAIRQQSGNLPLIKISRIKNDTGLKINMVDYLVTPIEEVMINSGKTDFFSEDKLGGDISAARGMLGTASQPRLPDFVLHGTVSKLQSLGDEVTQNAYVFQLRLTNTATNNVVFVGSDQIIKQGR